jgi:hypothetical protein
MSVIDQEFLDFVARGMAAQRVVDEVLSPEQQRRERQADGTYRVRCLECGRSVSNPLPVPVILRAYVCCPECVAAFGEGSRVRSRPTTDTKE